MILTKERFKVTKNRRGLKRLILPSNPQGGLYPQTPQGGLEEVYDMDDYLSVYKVQKSKSPPWGI
jgi:hypothetical protein